MIKSSTCTKSAESSKLLANAWTKTPKSNKITKATKSKQKQTKTKPDRTKQNLQRLFELLANVWTNTLKWNKISKIKTKPKQTQHNKTKSAKVFCVGCKCRNREIEVINTKNDSVKCELTTSLLCVCDEMEDYGKSIEGSICLTREMSASTRVIWHNVTVSVQNVVTK